MFLFLFIPHALVLFQFLFFTFSDKNVLPGTLFRIVEVLVIVFILSYLLVVQIQARQMIAAMMRYFFRRNTGSPFIA